jgi:hypothetical protein
MRYVLASFLAPLSALAVPIILALYEMNSEALVLADGSYDDASQKGAVLFLLLAVPILYIVAACFYAGAAHVLAKLGRSSRKSFLWVAAVSPWSLVILGAVGLIANNHSYFLGLLILLVIGLAMSLFAVGGAVTWLFIAVPKVPANPAFQRTASGGR